MYSIDDIKQFIQEWFAECSDAVEVAKTYAEISKETDKQLIFMLDSFTETAEK